MKKNSNYDFSLRKIVLVIKFVFNDNNKYYL